MWRRVCIDSGETERLLLCAVTMVYISAILFRDMEDKSVDATTLVSVVNLHSAI